MRTVDAEWDRLDLALEGSEGYQCRRQSADLYGWDIFKMKRLARLEDPFCYLSFRSLHLQDLRLALTAFTNCPLHRLSPCLPR